MRKAPLSTLPFIFLAGMCLPSCQTLQGLGNDLNHLGKSVTAPRHKDTAISEPAQKPGTYSRFEKSNRGISPVFAKTPDPHSQKPKVDVPKRQLQRLQPALYKEGMFPTQETPEPLSLEDLSTKTDIQEIPQRPEPWSGTTVDVNGDGIPDVRYRQRAQ